MLAGQIMYFEGRVTVISIWNLKFLLRLKYYQSRDLGPDSQMGVKHWFILESVKSNWNYK